MDDEELSLYVEIQGNSHLDGLLSNMVYTQSPKKPLSVTYEELISSRTIDFRGYRDMETAFPINFGALSRRRHLSPIK